MVERIFISGSHRTGKTTALNNNIDTNKYEIAKINTMSYLDDIRARLNVKYDYQNIKKTLSEQEKKNFFNVQMELYKLYEKQILSYTKNVAFDRSLMCIMGYINQRFRENKEDTSVIAHLLKLDFKNRIKKVKGDYLVSKLDTSIKVEKSENKDGDFYLSNDYRLDIEDAIYQSFDAFDIKYEVIK